MGSTFWEPEDLEAFEKERKRRKKLIIDEYIDNCDGYSKRKASQTDLENMRNNGTFDNDLPYNKYRG